MPRLFHMRVEIPTKIRVFNFAGCLKSTLMIWYFGNAYAIRV
ncbi:hypothetical protein SAMN04487772_11286 [[Clostridium] polysaccharolyticum]|uniref:Uncharacterized protein n=1 Tax=[Clostridium] polysaccharolyticum TaxID=29364 RepID=A0A1I0D2I3_9FIRM|nr:hypothetical protein SAMN04487772_11286 [[Clostridium] polysaccharolyticum]